MFLQLERDTLQEPDIPFQAFMVLEHSHLQLCRQMTLEDRHLQLCMQTILEHSHLQLCRQTPLEHSHLQLCRQTILEKSTHWFSHATCYTLFYWRLLLLQQTQSCHHSNVSTLLSHIHFIITVFFPFQSVSLPLINWCLKLFLGCKFWMRRSFWSGWTYSKYSELPLMLLCKNTKKC